MSENSPVPHGPASLDRLESIERRLLRLERRLGLGSEDVEDASSSAPIPECAGAEVIESSSPETAGQDLEFLVGQSWFARVGIITLALGGALALALPYPSLPPALPSLAGLGLVGVLWLLAHACRDTFALVSSYLRGAALALLYFAALRLFFFGQTTAGNIASPGSRILLSAVVAIIVAVAWRRDSPYLMGVGLATGYSTAVATGTPAFVFPAILLLSALAVYCSVRRDWSALLPFVIAGAYFAHLVWALDNPLRGNRPRLLSEPFASVAFLLAYAVVLGAGSLLRADRSSEQPLTVLCALLNCGLGYGLFLLHTAACFPARMVAAHLGASFVLLALAIAFWVREQSRASTFFYAMTGYAALSVALLKAVPPPNVFVWLSVQSVVVVATALWFRSRFIVVANSFIFFAIVLGYVLTRKAETGISLGFGLVALVTARVLNWQQSRLELKTDAIRNAYLLCALLVFPYALYHLVPRTWVAVAWVGAAVVYYLLNLVVRSPKYRWMGHITLLATALYVVAVGTTQMEPAYRILSFGVLGSVLLVVSLIFTRLSNRSQGSEKNRDRTPSQLAPADRGDPRSP